MCAAKSVNQLETIMSTPESPLAPSVLLAAALQPSLLEMRDVSRTFSVQRGLLDPRPARLWAVKDVSLSVRPGETLGLVGESGCGKSTLARMAVRLLQPSSGEIWVQGRNVESMSARELARQAQMVFQDPFSSLNPRKRVGVSVAEPLLLADKGLGRKRSGKDLRAVAEAMLERVGLPAEYYDRYPHEFSGGQRQRVAVARALIAGPRLLVCDEPVSALDASVQAQVLNLLKDMQDELGLAYLFISHDLGVVGFMSDRVAVMYLGRVVELAERETLFGRPAHPYTEALLASVPAGVAAQALAETAEGSGFAHVSSRGPVAALSGELPSPIDPPSGCAFHPRCPYAQELCMLQEPVWTELPGTSRASGEAAEHGVRCHFPILP